jgi:hypothetical protein
MDYRGDSAGRQEAAMGGNAAAVPAKSSLRRPVDRGASMDKGRRHCAASRSLSRPTIGSTRSGRRNISAVRRKRSGGDGPRRQSSRVSGHASSAAGRPSAAQRRRRSEPAAAARADRRCPCPCVVRTAQVRLAQRYCTARLGRISPVAAPCRRLRRRKRPRHAPACPLRAAIAVPAASRTSSSRSCPSAGRWRRVSRSAKSDRFRASQWPSRRRSSRRGTRMQE